jgi:hypothetical protein
MIESIMLGDLESMYGRLPFPYRAYRQWQDQDAEPPDQFPTVASCTAKVRPREEWNTLGREIYDVNDVERHADIVSRLVSDLKLTEFLVQQSLPAAAWFHGNPCDSGGRANVMMAYLKRCGVSVDFASWRGAFIVREDVNGFLRCFLDYPFSLNTYAIEMCSTQGPLALILDHHLCVEYFSQDALVIRRIKTRILTEGILEYTDRGAGDP